MEAVILDMGGVITISPFALVDAYGDEGFSAFVCAFDELEGCRTLRWSARPSVCEM